MDDPATIEWHHLCNQLRQIIVERQQQWRRHAACQGLPTAWWFTERGDPYSNRANTARYCTDTCRKKRNAETQAAAEADRRWNRVNG